MATTYRACFVLDNSMSRLKKPILKILYSRNSKVFVWNTIFCPMQAVAKFFLFVHSTYTEDTPYQVCSDLDNSFNRWKRPIFIICYSRNSKISVWNTNFFLRQAISKIPFFPHSTQGILNTLVQFRQLFDPMKKIFFKICYSRNSQTSVWKTKIS